MTLESRTTITSNTEANILDNNTKDVDPADVRNIILDILDSYVHKQDNIKFTHTFVVADWSAPSGGFRTLTITAATHGLGTEPDVIGLYTGAATPFAQISIEEVSVAANGDVTLKVADASEFDGKVVLL